MCNPRPMPQGRLGSWFTVGPHCTLTPQAIPVCFTVPYRGQVQRRIVVSVDLKPTICTVEHPITKRQVILDTTTS